MDIYTDARVSDLQSRFREICAMVDAEIEPVHRFAPNHRSEVYKAILKSLVIGDATLVNGGVDLALEKYPGRLAQVYPMLHLPNDTNERGGWHRDDKIDTRRVFWVPLTLYKYPGLSVIPWSEGALSFPLAFAGSKLVDLDVVASKINVVDKAFYAWSPRMIHRGNLNTSAELSSALVIFIDQGEPAGPRDLPVLTRELVRERMAAITSAIAFDGDGQIAKMKREELNRLDQPFRGEFEAYFKLRTKLDLQTMQAASA